MKFKPQCIWCNAEWSDSNVHMYADISSDCPTCGAYVNEITLKIICHVCDKTMYEKEQNGNDYK